MEKLEKATHIIYKERNIPDNLNLIPTYRFCFNWRNDCSPLEIAGQPSAVDFDSISGLAKRVSEGVSEINVYDGIITIESPKILPGHGVVIEPVSANELVEFIRAYRNHRKNRTLKCQGL